MTDKEVIKKRVIEALKQVYDPEIPVNIYDLGLVYEIDVDDEGNVKIVLGLTAPGCPMAGFIVWEVERVVKENIPEVKNVVVELDLSRPWDPRRITREGRERLKQIFGYDVVEEWIRRFEEMRRG